MDYVQKHSIFQTFYEVPPLKNVVEVPQVPKIFKPKLFLPLQHFV
jgi:hypothetical protein